MCVMDGEREGGRQTEREGAGRAGTIGSKREELCVGDTRVDGG